MAESHVIRDVNDEIVFGALYIRGGNGSVIRGNTITNCSGRGIWLRDNYHDVVIEDNTVTNNKEEGVYSGASVGGVYVYVDRYIILNNKILNNSEIGLSIFGGINDSTIKNNEVANNGDHAIYIIWGGLPVGRGNIISGNTVYNNSGQGLYLSVMSDSTITENNVSDNGGWGIQVDGGKNNTLSNNSCSGNSFDGLDVASDDTIVSDNRMMNNKVSGIYVNNAQNITVINNDVRGNEGGIDVHDQSGVIIRDNEV